MKGFGEKDEVTERDALWYARLALRLCQAVWYAFLIASHLL
jgi:hypothetical protein